MKYLKRFNEADIFNPHARKASISNEVDNRPHMLDIVKGGDVEALESYLQANQDKLERFVNQAARLSAPGSRFENAAIYNHVMDNYGDLVDMEAVKKWIFWEKGGPKKQGRDIDEEGNDWYYFDHPEDMK